jgi:hypothetical protein
MTLLEIFEMVKAIGITFAAVCSGVGVIITARTKREVGAIKHQTDGLVKVLGEAKLAQGTAEGTAVGLQQGRDEAKRAP